jgi:hypothetical protein
MECCDIRTPGSLRAWSARVNPPYPEREVHHRDEGRSDHQVETEADLSFGAESRYDASDTLLLSRDARGTR